MRLIKATSIVALGSLLLVSTSALAFTITKIADCTTPNPNGGLLCGFHTPSIDRGVVGFGANGYSTIVKYTGGSFQVVADTNTPVPGGSGNFFQFAYSVSVSGMKVGFENWGQPQGFYRGDGTTIEVVGDQSTPFPGGTTFHGFGGQFAFTLDGDNAAFIGDGYCPPSGCTDWGFLGVFKKVGGSLQVVATGLTAIPAGVGTFTGFDLVSLNGSSVAFRGGDPLSGQLGIYTDAWGALQVVADRNTPMPAGATTFGNLGWPSLSNAQIAFWGTDTTPNQDQQGIYLASNGMLEVVADTQTAMPGFPVNFHYLGVPSLDSGNVVFSGQGPAPAFLRGVYVKFGDVLTKVVDLTDPEFGDVVGFDSGPEALSGNQVAFTTTGSLDSQNRVYVATLDDFCGNRVVDPGEQCDDGNSNNNDGCKNDCTLNVCGDGFVYTGVEQCDDGNLVSGDDCDANCTLTGCGNGIVTGGEQCDDGNTTAGDGCSLACQSELSPGGGLIKTDCTQEWLTTPVPEPDRKGLPKNRLECTDGDPGCDFGAVTGSCTFHVALCFNAAEQRFACTASSVERVQLQAPRESQPRDDIDKANRDAIEAALAGLNGAVRGQCSNSGPHRGQLCTVNADCDSTTGSGNGRCTGRFVAFTPPLTAPDRCTTFASIIVPLRQTAIGYRARTKTLQLKAMRSDRASDTDSLTLICKP